MLLWHLPAPFNLDAFSSVQLNGPLEPTVRLNAFLGGKIFAFVGMFVLFVLYGVADVAGAFRLVNGCWFFPLFCTFFLAHHIVNEAREVWGPNGPRVFLGTGLLWQPVGTVRKFIPCPGVRGMAMQDHGLGLRVGLKDLPTSGACA